MRDELGDVLWYVAALATKLGVDLDDIARANLEKTRDRWLHGARRPRTTPSVSPDPDLPRTPCWTSPRRRGPPSGSFLCSLPPEQRAAPGSAWPAIREGLSQRSTGEIFWYSVSVWL